MSMMPMDSAPTENLGEPPDARPMTLEFHLQSALALIKQDRVLAPEEMKAVGAFLFDLQEFAQQMQSVGMAGGGAPVPATNVPPGGEAEDYGAGMGSPVEGL